VSERGKRFLTKTDLGVTEQLGSQMARYCTMETLARDTGHEFVFFEGQLDQGVGARALFREFDIPNRILPGRPLYAPRLVRRLPGLRERAFVKLRPDERVPFDERLSRLSRDSNYDLAGYFGLYEHWKKNEADFLRTFRFKEPVQALARRNVDEVRARCGGRELLSVHVRRNDYLKSSVHVNLSPRYFEEALAAFRPERAALLVFSDDIAWCQNQSVFKRREAFYSRGNTAVVDMCMMSLCDHHVVVNSSFSFWGALLGANPAKTVVCPRFFVKPGTFSDWANGRYYPPSWVALETT
jgi:hypothetical protein